MSNTFKAPALPEVKFNKNGYEIRTDILNMARNLITEEYHAKFAGWELTAAKNHEGQLVTSVSMPVFPGLDTVLETAEKMYSFVNQNAPAKSAPAKSAPKK